MNYDAFLAENPPSLLSSGIFSARTCGQDATSRLLKIIERKKK